MSFDPDKYLASKTAAAPAAGGFDPDAYLAAKGGDSDIIEEMHPDISVTDRAIVKNFSTSAKGSLGYLQEKYPQLEFTVGDGERILARTPGEQKWKTLDPNAGFFANIGSKPVETLKELGMDIGDVGWDVGSGVVQGAATAAGGLTGSLPGAAAAGAGSGALLETARQGLGAAAGVKDNMSGGDIAGATVFGAASPLLFGSGAKAGQIAAQASKDALAAGKEITETELRDQAASLAAGQRGMFGRLRDYVAPRTAELVTGIPGDVVSHAYKNLDEIKNLEKGGVEEFIAAKHENLSGALWDAKNTIGAKIGAALDAAQAKVDLKTARAPLEELLQKLETQKAEINNPALLEKIGKVKGAIANIFEETVPAQPASPILNMAGAPVRAAVAETTKPITNVSARAAMTLKQELGDLAELSKTDGGILSRLFPKSQFEKQIGAAADKSYRALGDQIDVVTKAVDKAGGTNVLNAEYRRFTEIQKNLAPYFSNTERTYNTFRNLGNKPKRVLLERLQALDTELGTDMADSAKMIQAFSAFGHAPKDAVSIGGATSTSKTIPLAVLGTGLGAYAGAQSDMGAGGAALGGALGGFAGAKFGSPAMLRLLMEGAKRSQRGAAAARDKSGFQYAPTSAWNALVGGGAGQ